MIIRRRSSAIQRNDQCIMCVCCLGVYADLCEAMLASYVCTFGAEC